jgi:hypothetical protein
MIDFDLDVYRWELDSEEATNFGLAVRPMTVLERAGLVLAYVRLS